MGEEEDDVDGIGQGSADGARRVSDCGVAVDVGQERTEGDLDPGGGGTARVGVDFYLPGGRPAQFPVTEQGFQHGFVVRTQVDT